ncbi:aldolase/citrate lyase/malate synthase family protein [Pedobacter caeni]|uniref:HpcH/HpaI aldolase/citrate lyase family protein n=1 Tax=Pedobacter caeni TaxID=288992 RepID=A0A1M5PSA9_9SPHI|nr:aldolase/citrate lyase family protein [Pedobacter caeni]SHH04153.1 HpcH/HpaI aldolase/citrate lyase family protein [Pedobacter caeni]
MEFLIIENKPERARAFDEMGVDRIFLDLEIIGKIERQGHLDTVISQHHQIEDIDPIKKELQQSKLLVRCNPIHEHSSSEINEIIGRGADIIMLPFFKSHFEVEHFLAIVDGRVGTTLLLETPEAFCRIDNILALKGIEEIHIGLNDLHLGMGLNFMFELISTGVVDYLVKKIEEKGLKFGIGGIANLEGGLIPGKSILSEHVRLGSSMAILSRSMTNSFNNNLDGIGEEVKRLRAFEAFLLKQNETYFREAHADFVRAVNNLVEKKIKTSG